jgi:transaldolase/glucose-6-phosphate isomerase
MTPVKRLQTHGQAVWLDFLARGFIAKGQLKHLIDTDGVRGVTSNPAIFEKAIAGSNEYDDALSALIAERDRSIGEIYEALAVQDIQRAADVLRPVYDALNGADGFVSLEVSPYLAHDVDGTIAEARKLWHAVDRKNLMVKVPGTHEGLPAVRQLTAEGINVNITLLFSQKVYVEVLEAYLSGLESWTSKGGDPSRVASVASFFVSRIDTAVDKQLDEKIAAANDDDQKARLRSLKGKVAIANAKLAYQHYERICASPRWQKLADRGARVQRLLWASTGTKNKDYSDVLYVEELIGRDTVNTVPPPTLDAFRDHGKLRDSLEEDIAGAERILAELARAGVSLDAITDELVSDGVKLFAEAADKLLGAVAQKRARLLGARVDGQTLKLGPSLEKQVKQAEDEWRSSGKVRLLWQRDASLWTGGDEHRWLGWLDSVEREQRQLERYSAFADWVKSRGFTDAVVLGMGGSSLGPEVLAETFGKAPGFPKLRVLDSTDPAQISRLESALKLESTLFIVSSKSGTTLEPNVLMDYFFARVDEKSGKAGAQFVAVTDPGSTLEKTAKAKDFAHIFHGEPSIGGRYSVLSPFGLVPAAASGIKVANFLETAAAMVRACGADVPPAENPGVQLGLALGVAARQGRDKVTLSASNAIADFGAWTEQLIAESTGKLGKALIPLADETLGAPGVYGSDRIFVDLRLKDDAALPREAALAALEKAGHPVVRIDVSDTSHVGQEFFRFEIATAVAGAVIGINPFDQPDVEAAKVKARELTAAFDRSGKLPTEQPVAGTSVAVYTDTKNAEALRRAGADGDLSSWVKAHLGRLRPGDYAALLAYLDRDDVNIAALQEMRLAIRDSKHVATCIGFGPRFLHSTGQAFKGGPNSGVFLQITADEAKDLAIPGQKASFGVVLAAQAGGDFGVLSERGRRALRLHIKGDVGEGLSAIKQAVRQALS